MKSKAKEKTGLDKVLEDIKLTPKDVFQRQWKSIKRSDRSGVTVADFLKIQDEACDE